MKKKSNHRRLKNLETDFELKAIIIERIKNDMKVINELLLKLSR